MRARRRTALAGAAVTLLLLAGCSAPADEQPTPDEQVAQDGQATAEEQAETDAAEDAETTQSSPDGTAGACDEPEDDLDRAPDLDPEPLAEMDPAGTWLPYHLEARRIVQTPFDVLPAERGEVFLAPEERDGALTFSAVDAEGSVLWTAERPRGCAGFTLAGTEDGQDLAVLTDVDPDGDSGERATTTATAYDLRTGELAWGPVPVGGPHVGPGLVFAAPGAGPIGDGGARLVLDAATGEILAGEEEADARVLGEYDGTVLMVAGDDVLALAGAAQEEVWRLDATEYGWDPTDLAPAAGTGADSGVTRLQVAPGVAAAIDLEQGLVLAEDATDAVVEESTGTRVVLEGEHARGYDARGEELWAYLLTEPTTIEGAGGVMVYLRSGDSVRVHNVLTGEVAEAYDPQGQGEILVPGVIAANGATVVVATEGYPLVTIVADEDQEPQE
ncbi:hypothetical protein [Pseudactinotalea sp. Z1748]|uniref:hypothetical protein n=1 Tax=Pseudactinotalea sp. Z1748 TaxID=3413027 RepID=UPI003C799D12